jgi:hypothetical protein
LQVSEATLRIKQPFEEKVAIKSIAKTKILETFKNAVSLFLVSFIRGAL